jgi:hypothetical protein
MKNEILATHPGHYVVDISTPRYPKTKLLVDREVWDRYLASPIVRRVFATGSLLEASVFATLTPVKGSQKAFSWFVLPPKVGFSVRLTVHGNEFEVDNRLSNLSYHEFEWHKPKE